MRRALVLLAPAALAFSLSLWLTAPPGPGFSPDSISYLGAGRSVARGHGLRIPTAGWADGDSTSPLRHFPPGFPLAIGLTVRLGATPSQGARLLVALAAATTAAGLAALLLLTGPSPTAALLAVAVMLVPAVVQDHVALLSEPMFLALLVLTLQRMAAAPERPAWYLAVGSAAAAVRYAGLSLLAWAVVWALWRPRGNARSRLYLALGGFATCYLAEVVSAQRLVYRDIPLDQRILSPLILCVAVAAAVLVQQLWSLPRPAFRAAFGALVAVWIAGELSWQRGDVADVRADGYDYAGSDWEHSPTIAWLRANGAGHALFSNNPVPIFHSLGRPSRDVPTSIDADTLRQFAATLASHHGLLVAFADTSWQAKARAADVAAALKLAVAARFADGMVWSGSGDGVPETGRAEGEDARRRDQRQPQ